MTAAARFQFRFVATAEVDTANGLTDFSRGADPPGLRESIAAVGLTHPPALTPHGAGYRVVSGHRRLRAVRALGLQTIPANLLDAALDDAARLAFNLTENRAHRQYSDIETAAILSRLRRAGSEDGRIIEQYMPILGLERSKKLLDDFLSTAAFDDGLQQLLHDANIPLRVYAPMFRWDDAGRAKAAAALGALRPGVNKWRELVQLLDETARRDGVSPADLLDREEVRIALQNTEAACDAVRGVLRRYRFPTLSRLQKEVWLAMDQLKLSEGVRLRVPETFEHETIRIELAFKSEDELAAQMERLSTAARSQAMRDLIQLFKNSR
ncbi:MAG: ParB/RepB/Spo0J family partition protein [Nitrospinales bacterium]